jgi:hypothetical protein
MSYYTVAFIPQPCMHIRKACSEVPVADDLRLALEVFPRAWA